MSKGEAFDVLGIDGTADYRTVRKAYRTLMAKFHPDSNKAPDAVENYKRVQVAYGIIGASSMMTGLSWFESLGGSDRKFKGPAEIHITDVERPDDIRKYVSSGHNY